MDTEGSKLELKTQQQVTKDPDPLLLMGGAPLNLSWLFQESHSPNLKGSKLGKEGGDQRMHPPSKLRKEVGSGADLSIICMLLESTLCEFGSEGLYVGRGHRQWLLGCFSFLGSMTTVIEWCC